MGKECQNIYRKARDEAGFTREKVYALTSISDSSLKAYESGKTVPGDDVVLLLCEVYRADWLGLEHLVKHNPIIRRFAETPPAGRLCDNLVRFQKEKADVDHLMPALFGEACNGSLKALSRSELREMIGSAMALLASA